MLLRVQRRLAVAFLSSLCMLAGIVALATPASACDNDNHCYGIAISAPSGIKGVHATISPYYLSSATGSFTTHEVWLASSSGGYWVEIGYIRNFASIDGVGQGFTAYSTSNSMVPAVGEVGSETSTASACSRALDYSMGYSTGSGWANFPSASVSADPPQAVRWITNPASMDAGITC